MIKTIIFDIGNVLTVFGWKDYIHSFNFDEAIEKRVAFATVGHPFWHEFDRGNLSDEQMLAGFIANDPGVEQELRQIFQCMHGIVTRADYAVPWITKLKNAGYRVLVLSNFSEKIGRDCEDALDFLKYVDGGILSYEDHCIKPEPEIYTLLLNRYQLIPEECVFLDDMQANLDAAGELGIHTILFENFRQGSSDLERLVNSQYTK